MKLWKYIAMIIVIFLSVEACQIDNKNKSVSSVSQISNVSVQKDGIAANYPTFISGGTDIQMNNWNKIIDADVKKILNIYSFNPFPEPQPTPTTVVPIILMLSYDIKENNNQIISILYTAAYQNPYSAHPTNLVYSTNIDKNNSERVRLSDYVKLNKEFVKDFRTWDFITYEEGNEELNQAIRDYLSNINDKDLLIGLKAADQINSDNLWDIYSYLTPDRLGISIQVPNYIGDHVEFEKDYDELGEFLNPDFDITPQK